MFVKSVMIPKHQCIIIQHDSSLFSALQILDENQIDAAPVLRGNVFVGIITKYRIYEGFFELNQYTSKNQYLTEVQAETIAKKRYLIFSKDEIFERAIYQLRNNPVAGVEDDEGNFVGIITRYDMFEQFRNSLGAEREGLRLTLSSVECEGRIALLAELAAHYHENIISLLTFDATDKLVRRIILKVEKTNQTDQFMKKLENSGFKIIHAIEIKNEQELQMV